MQTNKSDGAKMIRKMIVDIAKSQSMDQCKNQNKVRVNIYIYVWCIYIYNEYGDVAVLGTEHMTWNFKTDRSPVDPSNILVTTTRDLSLSIYLFTEEHASTQDVSLGTHQKLRPVHLGCVNITRRGHKSQMFKTHKNTILILQNKY